MKRFIAASMLLGAATSPAFAQDPLCGGVQFGLTPDGSTIVGVGEDGRSVRSKPFAARLRYVDWPVAATFENRLSGLTFADAATLSAMHVNRAPAREAVGEAGVRPSSPETSREPGVRLSSRENVRAAGVRLLDPSEINALEVVEVDFDPETGASRVSIRPGLRSSVRAQAPIGLAVEREAEAWTIEQTGYFSSALDYNGRPGPVDVVEFRPVGGGAVSLHEEERLPWPIELYDLRDGALVLAYAEADTRGLYRYAVRNGDLELTTVRRRRGRDVSSVAIGHGGEPLWVEYAGATPEYEALSDAGERMLELLSPSGPPARHTLLGASMSLQRALVLSRTSLSATVLELDLVARTVETAATCVRPVSASAPSIPFEFDNLTHGGRSPGLLDRPVRGTDLLVYVPGGPTVVFMPGMDGAVRQAARVGFDTLQLGYPGMLGAGRSYERSGRLTQHQVARAHCAAITQVRAEHDYDRVVLMGSSYGGLLAALTALEGCDAVDGYVLLSAAYDPSGLAEGGLPVTALGAPGNEEAARYWKRHAPARSSRPVTEPMLIVHPRSDTLIPFDSAQSFAELQRRLGGQVRLCALPGDHDEMTDEAARWLFSQIAALPTGDPAAHDGDPCLTGVAVAE